MKLGLFDQLVLLLTVLFIALKLTGVIAWSWWMVAGPLLVWAAVVIACIFLLLLASVLSEFLGW